MVIEEQNEESVTPLPERSELERSPPDGGEDVEGLPWHHAQLVLLYGRHVADDIMHPKMETQNKSKMPSELFNQEGKYK